MANFLDQFEEIPERPQSAGNFLDQFEEVGSSSEKENNSQPEKSGLLRKIKHLILGVTDMADLPNALSEVSKLQANTARAMNPPVDWGNGVDFGQANIVEEAPRIPSLSNDILDPAIDKVTGGLTAGEPDFGDTALRYASAMYSPAALAAKAGSKVAKAASVISSKRPVDVAGAAAMGGTTQALEDAGVNEGTSAVAGLAAGIAPALLFKGKKYKNVDMETLQAAERVNIDAPKNTFIKTPFQNVAQNVANHSLMAGKASKDDMKKSNLDFIKAIDHGLDKTTVKNTYENQAYKKQLYNQSKGTLTDKDTINPINTFRELEKSKQEIQASAMEQDAKKKYLTELNKVEHDINVYLQKNNTNLYPVRELMDAKIDFNKTVDRLYNSEGWHKELKHLKDFRDKGFKEDIQSFWQNSTKTTEAQKWYEAEALHAKMSNSVELRNMLKLEEFAHPELNFDPKKFASTYKNIMEGGKKSEEAMAFVKMIGGEEHLGHFKDIVQVAVKTPTEKVSNLALNMKIMAAVGGAGYMIGSLLGGNGLTGSASSLGGYLAVDAMALLAIKNKRYLKAASNYAKKPSPENSKKLKNTISKEFNMSVDRFNTELRMSLLAASQQIENDESQKGHKTQAKVTFKGSPGTEFVV